MNTLLHTFSLKPDWELISKISKIDRFDASWLAIEKREGQSLKQLKSIAKVRSVGASTRIEGSKKNDDEVEVIMENVKISKFEDRDAEEIRGYREVLDIITESFEDIEISESSIKHLHNILHKYSDSEDWHRGDYKQQSNALQATYPDGTKNIIMHTTDPGYATEDAMRALVKWYYADKETLPIIRTALFVYEFLSIHPFQDGNGRMSRLLTTLLLLKNGYTWIQYMSFEHEIENRKTEYYKVLLQCQKQRPGEDVYPWIMFFFNCLIEVQHLLLNKLKAQGITAHMTQKEKLTYSFIDNHPKSRSGEIADKLNIPLPTMKKLLADLVSKNILLKHGIGKGTYYTID